jgi:hypothetical protein
MANIETNASWSTPRADEGRSNSLALRLLELAIKAGWKPHECIEFAREAHKLITSTLPEAVAGFAARGPEPERKVATNGANDTAPPAPATTERPAWGPDPETRRKALQALADKNLMMSEAAEILGVTQSVVASAAHKLKVRFHGRRGRGLRRQSTANLRNGTPTLRTNGAAAARLLDPAIVDCRLKRRCPSCNQIFEPTGISHYVCEDCSRRA